MSTAGKETVAAAAAAMLILSLSFTAVLPSEEDEIMKRGIPMVPKGCRDKCGNLNIFYPFGIGPNRDCYLNKWFLINCTESSSDGVEKPYLSSFSHHWDDAVREILNISLFPPTITMEESISPFSCGPTVGSINFSDAKLTGAPFLYDTSYGSNIFVLLGCGNALLATLPDHSILGGCTSLCDNSTTLRGGGCYGINCCKLTIDAAVDVKTYQVNYFSNLAVVDFSCSYAFFVRKDYWLAKSSRLAIGNSSRPVVPVVWRWEFPQDVPPPSTYRCVMGVTGRFFCACSDLSKGNPYLPNGCTDVDNNLSLKGFSTIIGVGATFGSLVLLSVNYFIYKVVRKRNIKRQRHKFFKRNGGLLLQQQLLSKEGATKKTKLFTAVELDKATDHFNANRILGRGAQGIVYKGMLDDGQIVAIKKSRVVDENQLEPFINEVVILSQLNHRNVVKLLGCCLDTEVPILVYEYISNGTLFSMIHNNFGDDELIPLSWDIRLRIASEVADALSYLHYATSIPIYHRDIKSSNILLDDKFRAKVSDFGTSRSISIDQTHLTTNIKGTFGYLDPEYFQSSQFTKKSDVYSFGVVIAELLTGQKPISFQVNVDEDRSLITRFIMCMEENRLMEILDGRVLDQGKRDDVMAVASLAERCLNINGKKRPTMKEVAMELEAIKASHSNSQSVMLGNIEN